MIKNYFYLNRLVIELKSILIGKTIHEAYTQDKNKLYLNISDSNNPDQHIYFNVEQNIPTFFIRDHHKAKKNIVYFFQDLLPLEIENVQIATSDRIIRFVTSKGSFYFIIRGNLTNFVFHSTEYIESFKKYENEELKKITEELLELEFVNSTNLNVINLIKQKGLDEVLNSIPFFNKKIRNELNFRGASTDNLLDIITEIYNENISIYIDDLYKLLLLPSSFHFDKSFILKKDYNDFVSAAKEYLILDSKYSDFLIYKKNKLKEINSKLEKISAKLNNYKKRLDEGSKEVEYKNIADLLLTNIYQLQRGISYIELIDYKTGNRINIQLDPKLSPNQNIDKYYEKSRDEKISFEKIKDLYNSLQYEYQNLLNLKSDLEKLEIDDFIKSKKIIKPKKIKRNMLDNIKYKEYLLEGNYHFYVGKDSKSNDLLTVKFAKQNDYWFHARGYAGSHGVLRIDNKKEVPPKSVLKKAASIVAFHSKAKTAKLAPVIYTFAKFVYKKKGAPVGQVNVTKEKVLLVKPEIPKDCEYIEKDN